MGVARVSQRVRFTAQSAATGYGHTTQLQLGFNSSLTAGGLLRYLAAQPGTLNLQAVETILLFAYSAVDGNIRCCPPFVQSAIVTLTNAAFQENAGIGLYVGLNPVMRQAFNNFFIALTDLLLPKGPVLVYNSSDATLYPASDLPFGAPWQPGVFYRVGQVVSPSKFETFGQTGGQGTWVPVRTGYLYQCTTAGISAAVQPAWPKVYDATVIDGGVTWTEATPIFISGLPDPVAPTNPTAVANSSSAVASNAIVYLACTYVNNVGEGINQIVTQQGLIDQTKVLIWQNISGGAVDLTVTLPQIPAYLGTGGSLGASYGATGLNLYAFIETTPTEGASQGADPSFYARVNSAPLAPGATVTLSAFPNGQQLQQSSTAATTPVVGNVDTGIRYLVPFFQMNTTYQTGFSNSAPIAVNVTQSGWPIQALRLPTGPYNCQARVVAATVSGASAAGPFTYISQSDVESPGFNQPDVAITSTMVQDNTSTTALFNFTDTYLPGASDVTHHFRKVQIPPSVDVYFANTLQRVVYTGAVGYQSGHLFSEIGNPETVLIPGGNLQVSENDGDRTVCYREIRGIGYSFKENSGFAIENTGGDPSSWDPRQVWHGNGPVGAQALDLGGQDDTEFAMWAHRSGLYMFTGGAPMLISREIQPSWNTINWDYGHLVKVRIDQVRRLVHILAPVNGSTVCNQRFVLNYYFGTAEPVVFIPRRGVLVPNVQGRKWSIDPLAFQDAVFIPQKSRSAVQLAGVNVESQMAFFAADGSIKTVTDGQYYDEDYGGNQVGYFSNWVGVSGISETAVFSKVAGVRALMSGNGLCNITVYDQNDNPYLLTGPFSPYLLTPGQRTRMDIPMPANSLYSLYWGVGIDNGGIAGAWWEAIKSDLMILPTWPGLPG